MLECVLGFGFMFNVLIHFGFSLINMNWLPGAGFCLCGPGPCLVSFLSGLIVPSGNGSPQLMKHSSS